MIKYFVGVQTDLHRVVYRVLFKCALTELHTCQGGQLLPGLGKGSASWVLICLPSETCTNSLQEDMPLLVNEGHQRTGPTHLRHFLRHQCIAARRIVPRNSEDHQLQYCGIVGGRETVSQHLQQVCHGERNGQLIQSVLPTSSHSCKTLPHTQEGALASIHNLFASSATTEPLSLLRISSTTHRTCTSMEKLSNEPQGLAEIAIDAGCGDVQCVGQLSRIKVRPAASPASCGLTGNSSSTC